MNPLNPKKMLAAAVIAAGAGAFLMPTPAPAQTATDLKCKGCVGTKQLGKESVTGKKIKKRTILNKHLNDSIKAAGAAFQQDGSFTDVGTDDTVASVILNVPAPGFAYVSVSGHSTFLNPNALTCDITTGATVTSTAVTIAGLVSGTHILPFTRTHMFAVTKGANTFNFVCSRILGADQIDLDSLNMSALYVAQNYTGN